MKNKTLIWTLIVAVPVGLAALAAGYIYRDTGRLPFQDGPATAVAPAGTGEAGQPSATAETPATGDDQAAGASAPAPGSDRISATFDVVGVEPTGETVVAGRSQAGAIVALTANGTVIGKGIANEAGEWTIILDEPLKPGDYDVGLEVHDDTGSPIATSEERVAVSLPEGGKEQPLIVLNTPDGPSDILQKPAGVQQVAEAAPQTAASAVAEAPAADAAAPAAAGEQQVASAASAEPANGQAVPAAAGQQAAAGTTAGDPESSASGVTAAADDPAAKPEAEAPADETQAAAVETQPAAAPASTEETAVADAPADGAASGVPASAASQALPAAAPEGQDPEATATPVVTAEASSAAPAATASQAAPQSSAQAAPAAPTITVEAVESEQDKVYVAGTGAPGSSVRVYVGDEFQGEAKVDAGGKWLVQGSKNIAEGNVEVRVDLIGSDGNAVDARAAVTFEKAKDEQIVLTKVVASGAGAGPEGQGAEVQKALPVVIIRKGDNLWRISRRLYGHGVRYTTIYQANQDQIRNPDLIYPGQVFLTPEGDLNWKPLPENNG